MNAIDIGNKLKELREASGLSAKEVSYILQNEYEIEMNHRTLFNYEKGRSSPDITRFLSLCKIYGCRDVLYEFGYSNKKLQENPSYEDSIVLEKYHALSPEGKEIIHGALGLSSSELANIKRTKYTELKGDISTAI